MTINYPSNFYRDVYVVAQSESNNVITLTLTFNPNYSNVDWTVMNNDPSAYTLTGNGTIDNLTWGKTQVVVEISGYDSNTEFNLPYPNEIKSIEYYVSKTRLDNITNVGDTTAKYYQYSIPQTQRYQIVITSANYTYPETLSRTYAGNNTMVMPSSEYDNTTGIITLSGNMPNIIRIEGTAIYVPPATYNLSYSLSNITASSMPSSATNTDTLAITFSAGEGYRLPSYITINGSTGSSGSIGATWTYDKTSGELTITNITDNLTIEASGVVFFDGYQISVNLVGLNFEGSLQFANINGTYQTRKLVAKAGYRLPTTISVNNNINAVGGQSGFNVGWTYNSTTGVIELNTPTQDISIVAYGVYDYEPSTTDNVFSYSFAYSYTYFDENGVEKWQTGDLKEELNCTYPFVGFSDVEARITGELNSGYIEFINNSSDNLPMFSIITMTIQDNSVSPVARKIKSFYVGKDNVEIVNKDNESYVETQQNQWLHKVELIDLTKKLEKYTLETITFTNYVDSQRYSILDGIQRLLRVFNIYQTDNETSAENDIALETLNYSGLDHFNLDTFNIYTQSLENTQILIDTELPQMVLSNLNLREAINELLKPINAICYLYLDTTTMKMYLDLEFYNHLNAVITSANQIDVYNQEHSADDYASSLDNMVSNQITENFDLGSSLIYPSAMTWGTVRTQSSNYVLTDSNFGILLPFDIFSINYFMMPFKWEAYTSYSADGRISKRNSLADILPYTVSSEQYENLDEGTQGTVHIDESTLKVIDLQKTNTIKYVYKSNFIDLSNTYKGYVFTNYSWKGAFANGCVQNILDSSIFINYVNTIASRLNTSESVDIYVPIYSESEHTLLELIFRITERNGSYYFRNSITVNLTTNDDLEYIRYRVGYIPIYDTRLKTHKEDTTEILNETSSFSNQSARIISLDNIGIADKSQIERVGNQNFSITKRHKELSGLYKNGDYINETKHIITKSEYIYYDDFILGKYEFTKNYSKLSEYIGINSEYRPYEIPNGKNVFERKVLYNNYCYIGQNKNYSTNASISSNARLSIVKSLYEYGLSGKTIGGALVSIDGMSVKWDTLISNHEHLYLPTISDGSANNIILTFTFNDNYNSGYYIVESGGKKLMQKVPYTLSGYATNMSVDFVDMTFNGDMSNLPLMQKTNDTYDLINLSNMLILKDSSEILKFVYELSFISTDVAKLIIGKDFARNNNLVDSSSKTWYIYGSNENYSQSENRIKGTQLATLNSINVSITENQTTHNFGVSFNGISLDYEWYAIGDKTNNKFLLAFTKEFLQNGIYFTFTDMREDIKQKY